MKTRWMHLITGAIMCVLCISVCTTTANAKVIWEDDFSDPNLPGWTIDGYIYTGLGDDPDPVEGNFSAADGTLKALDDDCNIARHESDTSIGTWSFDMFVPDDDDSVGNIYVEFLSNGSSFIEFGNASFLAVGAYLSWGDFVVWSIVGSGWTVIERIDVDPLEGWHHIDVSRNSSGYFEVYFNEELRANFTSLLVTSSTYLEFLCNGVTGAAIDNLVVSDDITDGGFDPVPIVIAVVAAGVVIIAAVVFIRRR